MVRADVIDAADRRLRDVKRSNRPFGGTKLVLFGDLYQLPPIVRSSEVRTYLYEKYGGVYFFNAKVWQVSELKIYELSTVFRQTDEKFRDILNEIREGKVSEKSLSLLNARVKPIINLPVNITILSSTNRLVNEINSTSLNKLRAKKYVYAPKTRDLFRKNSSAGSVLELKVGAQVMFTKNDPKGAWVNGSIGVIEKLSKRFILVSMSGKNISVPRVSWSRVEYKLNTKTGSIEEKEVNKYEQYPLKLAWSVTIHKSQGQTYDYCAIDLKRGAFAHGQAYVALSRCRSLEGLTLLSPIMTSDISVDPKIKDFMKRAVRV